MRKKFWMLAGIILATHLSAQTNLAPVRLAIVSETAEARAAADVLTAELSKNGRVQLLERAEIEKVYREQALSAGNKDYLKLGRILGADGLLLMETRKEGTNQFLSVRLVAVRPGVILEDRRIEWQATVAAGWAENFQHHLDLLLPKLKVLPQDAIPISVVNLRSAVGSTEGAEVERQLKLLTIQRLSREPQFFVLERERMQLLAEEKDLKLDDSAFWKGSYLLEGVVDQNGYSKNTITINARLVPPKGGAPVLLEVSGMRTNLAGVVNQLAAKMNAALQVSSTVKEWNAADEAGQYFEEARWALKWGVYSEAQMAAESAWALGKHDMDCATIRIKAYSTAIERIIIGEGELDQSAVNSVKEEDHERLFRYIKEEANSYQGVVYAVDTENTLTPVTSLEVYNSPTSQDLDRAIRALDLYREFSRTLMPDEPRVDSTWYALGVGSLTAAAQVLHHYYLVPKSQGAVKAKLEELRTLARSVSTWISQSPSVRNSYFVIDPDPDKERRKFGPYIPNIYQCEADWGCFWQETPEDCIILDRDLLSSPAFPYLASDIWGVEHPRLIAWNEEDRKRIPIVWDNFLRELNGSTNQFLQAEAQAFKKINAFGLNEAEIIKKCNEYWEELKSGKRETWAMEAQKHFLKEPRAWNDHEFETVFSFREYTKKQALEIQPLLTVYKSNLLAQLLTQSKVDRFGIVELQMQIANREIGEVQAKLDAILDSPSTKSAEPVATKTVDDKPTKASRPTASSGMPVAQNSEISNSLLVRRFLGIPQEQLWKDVFVWPGEESEHGISNERVVTCRWRDGRLLLGLKYYCTSLSLSGDNYAGGTLGAAALLDPKNGHWDVIVYPKGEMREYGSVEMFRDSLYLAVDDQSIVSGNQVGHNESILKYDFKTRQWEKLKIQSSGAIIETTINQGVHQLFSVNNHLFAANFESIFEITDDDRGTHIIASTRRQPAASTLDLLGSLGAPMLFPGPNNLLRAGIGSKIYSWDGKDWQEMFDFDFGTWGSRMDIFEDACLIRKARPEIEPYGQTDETLWVLQKDQSRPELCLYEKARRGFPAAQKQTPIGQTPHPLWELPPGESLINSGATFFNSDLYFFDDRTNRTISPSGQGTTITEKNGAVRLVCLTRDCPEPIVVPLKFDWQQGRPPLSKQLPQSRGDTWMQFAGNNLYISQPDTMGIWTIPAAELEAAVLAQKNVMKEQKRQREQRRQDFAVLDLNGRQARIADPNYLSLMLPDIDANHNGLLDAEELGFFKVGAGEVFGPQQQDAVDKTLGLLADKLLERLPLSQNGSVNPAELPVELVKLLTAPGEMPAIGIGRKRLLDLMRSHLNHSLVAQRKDAHISLPPGVVSNLNDFSVTAWVNLLSISTWVRILDFGSSQSSYMLLTPQSEAGVMRFAITTTGKRGEQQINGSSALPIGGWHHVAVTLGGGVGLLYLDGKPVGTNLTMTLTPSSLGNTTQNWIGRSQWPDPLLNGVVDEFRIYGRALTAGEVEALHTAMPDATSDGPTNALHVYLKLDESTGTTAVDSTGHGWNGTLVNGSNWVAGHSLDAVWLDNGASGFPGMMLRQTADPKLRFKESVEAYWRASHYKPTTAASP